MALRIHDPDTRCLKASLNLRQRKASILIDDHAFHFVAFPSFIRHTLLFPASVNPQRNRCCQQNQRKFQCSFNPFNWQSPAPSSKENAPAVSACFYKVSVNFDQIHSFNQNSIHKNRAVVKPFLCKFCENGAHDAKKSNSPRAKAEHRQYIHISTRFLHFFW